MLNCGAETRARVLRASFDVLELILTHEECDVDPINKLDEATPLHLAVVTEDPEDRVRLVGSLLEAGANDGFVHLIHRSLTATAITTCNLDVGCEINTGKQHRTSLNQMIRKSMSSLGKLMQRPASAMMTLQVHPAHPAQNASSHAITDDYGDDVASDDSD